MSAPAGNPAAGAGLWTGMVLLVVYLVGLLLLWRQDPAIARENALMENLQALSLALGALFSSVGLFLPNRRQPRLFFYVLAVLLLGLFLREVDVDRLDLPGILIAVGSGTGRNLLLAAAALPAMVVLVRDFKTLWPAACSLLCSRECLFFYLGVGFYLAGDLFDKQLIPAQRGTSLFLEELCENAATGFFLWGTIGLARGRSAGRDKRTAA